MIYRFEVEGFKGFSEKLTLDLTHKKNYEFNQDCIFNGVVKKGMIYGRNGIGKSNLGLALFLFSLFPLSLKISAQATATS